MARAATGYKAPSQSTAATELDLLSTWSTVVPDVVLGQATGKLKAATVSFGVLRGIVSSEQLAFKPYENAIAAAATFDRCSALSGGEKLSCQLDKALVNVGSMLAKEVEGRIATEVDPRLANDTAKLVHKAQDLLALYRDAGVPAKKVVIQLPGTWAGVQASHSLEGGGIATQVTMVNSLVQGVAAAQAGTSVIGISVGRLRDWYNKHPGVIRDPHGPRQDAGGSSVDPAIKLATDLWLYCKKHHPKTKIMASGIRTREDALALAGIDYLVLGPKVIAALGQAPTTAGYNDGLHAAAEEDGLGPQLTAERAARDAEPKMATIDATAFKEALGLAGGELLASGLKDLTADIDALKPFFTRNTLGVGA